MAAGNNTDQFAGTSYHAITNYDAGVVKQSSNTTNITEIMLWDNSKFEAFLNFEYSGLPKGLEFHIDIFRSNET